MPLRVATLVRAALRRFDILRYAAFSSHADSYADAAMSLAAMLRALLFATLATFHAAMLAS